ncbi:MAG: hypothetical protein Q4G10_03020 [Bacteroidia bacterium]|nr:hypothetical protein [Bacteroidia bacterium]
MKRIIASIALAAVLVMPLRAQTRPSNEFSLSYGVVSTLDIEMVLGSALVVVATGGTWNVKDMSSTGALSAQFYHNFNDRTAVGAVFSFEDFSGDAYSKEEYIGKFGAVSFGVMPAFRYTWLYKDHIGFYSRIAAGVNAMAEPEQEISTKDLSAQFAFQATLLGFEFGARNVRGFLEGGLGIQGLVLGGIKFAF